MNCKMCKHSHEGDLTAALERQYACRRYPPVSHPVPTQQGIATVTVWPAVRPIDTCGEYAPDLVQGALL